MPGDRPLKVCIATRAPFIGGAEMAAERLALGLMRAGHDVTMIVGQDNDVMRRFRDAGLRCKFCPLPMPDRKFFWQYLVAWFRLHALLHLLRPDIVHSNDLPTHRIVSDAAPRFGPRTICHHRFIFDRKAIDWMNKRGAALHLFVSNGLMEPMCVNSPKLAAANRAVVYDGLDLPATPTPADRAAARAELKLPADKTIILFAGQFIERKGVADLLQAWSRLPPEQSNQSLLVLVGDDSAGGGAYRRKMIELASSLNLGDRARFVGFQSNVYRWLTAADAAVVPSHVEPLGNATLEAMALSRPVIGSNVGGIPEMIVAGQTGLLVPAKAPDSLAVAIGRLIDDPPLREQLGRAGRKRCEEMFSLAAHTEAVLEHYRKLLKINK